MYTNTCFVGTKKIVNNQTNKLKGTKYFYADSTKVSKIVHNKIVIIINVVMNKIDHRISTFKITNSNG